MKSFENLQAAIAKLDASFKAGALGFAKFGGAIQAAVARAAEHNKWLQLERVLYGNDAELCDKIVKNGTPISQAIALGTNQIMGMRIIAAPFLLKTYYDYTACRSPSRAARRYKRGIKERVKVTQQPDKACYIYNNAIVMHPSVLIEIKRALPCL